MFKSSVIVAALIYLPNAAYSQRLDPTQTYTQPLTQPLGGTQLSGNPNQPTINTPAGNLNIGPAPVQGIGQATKGVGNQITGYGAQISGYGANVTGTTRQQGCDTYPPSPYNSTCR